MEAGVADTAPVIAIPLLADRVVAALDWAQAHPQTSSFPLGLFGASTGAAAALIAAATRPAIARAVVARGGRPDLAEASLDVVTAPTLLIVGGHDEVVIQLNRDAFARLKASQQLNSSRIVMRRSSRKSHREQEREVGRAWQQLRPPRPHVSIEIVTPCGQTDKIDPGKL